MKVLVTGANGFIGRNLIVRLNELGIQTIPYIRENSIEDLPGLVKRSDFIVHLAGENRPKDEKDFSIVNIELTSSICAAVRSAGKKVPIILTSSTQAKFENAYGRSKLAAEDVVRKCGQDTGSSTYIYRLPGVFGKWCKPNYNSVVATFCHNISSNLPVQVDDASKKITLAYVDDVIEEFVKTIQTRQNSESELSIQPEYEITLGDLASQIRLFKESRESLVSERVGSGFVRKLYSTYVSYLAPKDFAYLIPLYNDERGVFAEVLKTKDSGQFSFFTANPGVVRGKHYHHSKTEKFLVVQGKARFDFRNIISNETYEITVSANKLQIVETAPGWSHSITNVGIDEMIVILWANEVFDPRNPDTIAYKV